MQKIEQKILESIEKIQAYQSFKDFLEKNEKAELIQINNSFIHREVKSKKSEWHLFLKRNNEGEKFSVLVGEGIGQNMDFKVVDSKSKNLPKLLPLRDVLKQQRKKLGKILYVLVSEVKDDIHLEEKINNKGLKLIRWIPEQESFLSIKNEIISVTEVKNKEKVWDELKNKINFENEDDVKDALFNALDQLEKQAVARIEISEKSDENGILDQVLKMMEEHRNEYKNYLKNETQHINELRRIAYNFATDILVYLKLIVSICDLKPIVLWGTIGEHFYLSECFKQLSCFNSRTKVSVKTYQKIISDERNASFHKIISFNKTLKLSLPPDAIGKTEVTFFSEFTQKKNNTFDFPDKELVDILLDLTRVQCKSLSFSFWKENLAIIERVIDVFTATNIFIKLLWDCTEEKG